MVPTWMAVTSPLMPWMHLFDLVGARTKSSIELVMDALAQLSTRSCDESVSKMDLDEAASAGDDMACAA